MSYYRQPIDEVLDALHTHVGGLDRQEAERRLTRYGLNTLQTQTRINPLLIFLNQFKSFIIYILLFAVVFSLIIGEYVDSLIILAILFLNALIGFFQELTANSSLEALKKLSAVRATALRGGRKTTLDAANLVPGDIIHLAAGDKVPADARIIESIRLKVEEAVLTGESVPSDKYHAALPGEAQIGEQHNMLFSSTSVVTGNCKAVVTATGMRTEIGRITTLIKEAKEEMTPLQKRLDHFGRRLGIVIICVCIFIFLVSFGKEYLTNDITLHSFVAFAFIAISLAVAAVPTALPAVVTIALSIGVKRLLRKKALVRKLSSVETLGSCDIICTDKTGTLTQNKMMVRYGWTLDGEVILEGQGYRPEGSIAPEPVPLLFRIGQIANNASLDQEQGDWRITGDPTEAALLVSAAKAKIHGGAERRDELPFDSERKLMSVLVREEEGEVMYTKGAPGQLLDCCSHALRQGQTVELTEGVRREILMQNDTYASQAMRVLAFAFKKTVASHEFEEKGLVFVGLQAMIDPPREDVIASIVRTKRAGIRVIMVTGDYRETAKAIGEEIGITGEVMTGEQIERLNEEQLEQALGSGTNIFARVIPEHKQRIIGALQKMGHTVAMTGDGVNDAPALKKANIGVAVGSGTEVAKEASDFVLLDDSFTHIVNAIEEGRGIYDNIQKSIMLLLSGNLGEVLIIFIAVVLGLNLPLTAILLLWINMVTDGAPALAYTVDPYGKDTMERRPKPKDEGILPKPQFLLIGVLGCLGTAISLALFVAYGGNSTDPQEIIVAQTMVFNFVVIYECILVFVIRQSYRVDFFTNKWVWLSVILCAVLQALLMYTPLNEIFLIAPLYGRELAGLLAGALFFFLLSFLYQRLSSKLVFAS
jgi:Ca2+-transporting ATPase